MPANTALPDLEITVARARRLLALLRELTSMGMDQARALHRQVMAGGSTADIEIRFCRIAKAIRQLAALEMRLGQALDDVAAGRWEAEEAQRQLDALAAQAREETAIEAVEQAVREAGDGEAFKQLAERLNDWRAERSVERDFTDKTVAEIVVDACKSMGLEPDPALLTDEAMNQTLADAVRAYAAALKATPQRSAPLEPPDGWSPPIPRRPNALAEPRPPPA